VPPDFVWLPVTVEGDGYRGREGIERYFGEARDTWEQVRVIAEAYRDLGDRVLILGRFEGRGRGSGIPVKTPQGTIFDFVDLKISRIRSYLDHDEAVGAVGLDE
jgi:ketosteroid isomerase-like protein